MCFIKARRFFSLCAIILAVSAIVTGCTAGLTPAGESGSVQVTVQIPGGNPAPAAAGTGAETSGARFVHPDTKKIVVTILTDDVIIMTQTVGVSETSGEAVLVFGNVPAGADRMIHVQLYDAGDMLVGDGSATATVAAGRVTLVPITVVPQNPTNLTLGNIVNCSVPAGQTYVFQISLSDPCTYELINTYDLSYLAPVSVFAADGKHGPAASHSLVSGGWKFTVSNAGIFYVVVTFPSSFPGPTDLSVNYFTPEPPNITSVTSGHNSLTVTWTAASGATGYTVSYGTSDAEGDSTDFGDYTGTSATITGLTNDQNYYVWVRAKNGPTAMSYYSSGDHGTPVYAVGDTGPAGGLIFYVNPNYPTETWHYLEAAPADFTDGLGWGPSSVLEGYTGLAIGAGKDNTELLIVAYGSGSIYAFQACYAYTSGGFSDWFLPSRDEIKEMQLKLYNHSLGGLEVDSYWSSSEVDADHGWAISMASDYYSTSVKAAGRRTRPVRQF